MSRSLTKSRALGVGVAASLAAAALVGVAGGASAAPGTAGKAVPALGTAAGGTVVTITGTGFTDAAGASALDVKANHKIVTGTAPVCTSSGTALTSYSLVSGTKAVVTVPSATITSGTTLNAVICLKVKGASTYVAVPYTYGTQPVKHATLPLKPAAGPMSGGQTITLATTSAAPWQVGAAVLIDGVPATGVKIAAGGQTLTAVTPVSTSAGEKDVVVRTPGFADVKLVAASDDSYSFTRAIKVSPQTGPTSTATTISITGAGFLSSDYVGTGKAFSVYLDSGSGTPTACGELQVVSDTEATCEVPASLTTANVYKVVIADNATWSSVTAATKNVVSTGSVFTLADF